MKVTDRCKVYTPQALARAMVRAVEIEQGLTWLEPSVGHGAIIRALIDEGVSSDQIYGCELDEPLGGLSQFRRVNWQTEFLHWSGECEKTFDRIIANPPFVGFRELPPRLAKRVRNVQIPGTDCFLSGRSNLWFAFLCRTIAMLKPGGNFAFILPAAWSYASYAAPLRNSITSLFRFVYSINCRTPMFSSVEEGTVILLGKGFGEQNGVSSQIECAEISNVISVLENIGNMPDSLITGACATRPGPSKNCLTLSDEIEIRLGGVTGDSRYFVLSESGRRTHSLPTSSLVPVVTRSRHVCSSRLSSTEWGKLRSEDERIWLFRPPPASHDHPSVRRYLDLAPSDGGCNRGAYKVSSRSPWHMTPLPARFDGFISGMSSVGPFLSFRDMRRLNATNTLYVFTFKKKCDLVRQRLVSLALLTSLVRSQLNEKSRRYAGGLKKLEPSDLNQLVVPKLQNRIHVLSAYDDAVMALVHGDVSRAEKIADSFLPSGFRATVN